MLLSQERFDRLVEQRDYLKKLRTYYYDKRMAFLADKRIHYNKSDLANEYADGILISSGLDVTGYRVNTELEFLGDYLDKNIST